MRDAAVFECRCIYGRDHLGHEKRVRLRRARADAIARWPGLSLRPRAIDALTRR
jgi:hypothetical protein